LQPVAAIPDRSRPWAHVGAAVPHFSVKVTLFDGDGGREVVATRITPGLATRMCDGVRRPPFRVPGAAAAGSASADADNLARAARRARQKVRQGIRHRGLDRMLTLTYRENMQDADRLRRDWTRFLRILRERYGWRMPFVAVRELQQRGAWHMHVAIRGWRDHRVLRDAWREAIWRGVPYAWECGNIDIRRARGGGAWNSGRLAAYLTKYLSKDQERTEAGAKRYWISQGEACEVVRFLAFSEDVTDLVRELLPLMPDGTWWWVHPGQGVVFGSG